MNMETCIESVSLTYSPIHDSIPWNDELVPFDEGALLSRAMLYRSTHQYSQAIADASQVIDNSDKRSFLLSVSDDSFATAYLIRGDAYYGMADYTQSLQNYWLTVGKAEDPKLKQLATERYQTAETAYQKSN